MIPSVGDRITWTEFRGQPNERRHLGTVTEDLKDILHPCYRVISNERNCIVHAFKIDSVEKAEVPK